MNDQAPGMARKPLRRRFDMRDFSRVASWGLAALGALTLAAYAASSEVGEDRLILAVANFRGVPPPAHVAQTPSDTLAHQLAATVRELSVDREQLLARLVSLERNVGDVTGSIARLSKPPVVETPVPVAAPPAASPPPVVAVPEAPRPGQAVPDLPLPLPRSAPPQHTQTDEPAPPKTEFGIDLGRANSVDGLRQIWTAAKARHGGALEGLRPIVTVREIARAGGIELRLVAGPVPNAAAAARLCAMLPGAACHPTVFDGQRLALR